MEESKEELLTKNFTGSGNNEEDARAIAEVRYETWRKNQRKKRKVKFEEIEKNYTYDVKNSVYCKCTLVVSYTQAEV